MQKLRSEIKLCQNRNLQKIYLHGRTNTNENKSICREVLCTTATSTDKCTKCMKATMTRAAMCDMIQSTENLQQDLDTKNVVSIHKIVVC